MMGIGPRTRAAAVSAVVVVAIGAGVGLYVDGSDGSKQADLGVSLISTGGIGVLLIALERALARSQKTQLDRVVALGPPPEPTFDTLTPDDFDAFASDDMEPAPLEPDLRPGIDDASPDRSITTPHRYEIRFVGMQRDTTRVDAVEIRFRVLRDSEYFQFFNAIAPASMLRGSRDEADSLRAAFIEESVSLVRGEIAAGNAPLPDDPTKAITVIPDADAVVRRSRVSAVAMPAEDDIVQEWIA